MMFQKFWMNNVSHFFLRFFVVVDKRIGVLTVSGQFAQIAGSFSNTRHKLFLLFKNKFTIPRIKIKQKTFCGPHFKAAGFDQTPNLRKSRIPHSFERKSSGENSGHNKIRLKCDGWYGFGTHGAFHLHKYCKSLRKRCQSSRKLCQCLRTFTNDFD